MEEIHESDIISEKEIKESIAKMVDPIETTTIHCISCEKDFKVTRGKPQKLCIHIILKE